MYLLQKKRQDSSSSFHSVCSVLVIGGIVLLFRSSCAKLCKLRTSESQFSTAPERLHTCSDVTWDKLTRDQPPEAITIKKAKPIRDQARGVAPRWKRRKKEKMQNYPSASTRKVTINIKPTNK